MSRLFIGSSSSSLESENEKGPLLEKSTLLRPDAEAPKDWFKLTYIILFLQGIGHLLPWNMFITAHEYFENRFSCPSIASNHSSCHGFQNSFESYFSVAANLSTVVACAINVFIQTKVSFKYRMLAALIMSLILFAFTTAMVKVSSNKWVDEFFALTIVTVVILCLFSGLFQSSTFGFAGILPHEYTTIVMGGQACAGIFSSVSRIISTVVVKNSDITLSALIYFLSAVLVTFICLISFFVLLKLKFVQHHLLLSSAKALKAKQESGTKGSINTARTNSVPFLFIFKKVLVYGLSVFLVFAVSIGVFPGVISNTQSTVKEPQASLWTGSLYDALVCFLLFNCGDLAGRILSNWFTMPGKWKYVLFILSLLRFLFIPLVLMSNIQPRSDHIPVLLKADYLPVIITTLIGLTSGLFASLAMASAPGCVEPCYRETASVIMTWFLALGLLTGAVLSFLLIYLIKIH